MTNIKKYRFSRFKTPKNIPLIPVCKYANSTQWDTYDRSFVCSTHHNRYVTEGVLWQPFSNQLN